MFSCFALPNMFSAVPRVSSHVFMFCASGLVFGGPEGDGSSFHVLRVGTSYLILRARTRLRRYRACRVLFSCFALPESFPAVPRASSHVFMFCAPDSFSAVSRASGLVFMFCAPGHIFGGTEDVAAIFLHARTRFLRNRGRQLPFSCFAFPDSFSTVRRMLGPIFMFCAPEQFFGGTERIGSCFNVLRSRTRFRRYGERRVSISRFRR
jgi:hypothetical protein